MNKEKDNFKYAFHSVDDDNISKYIGVFTKEEFECKAKDLIDAVPEPLLRNYRIEYENRTIKHIVRISGEDKHNIYISIIAMGILLVDIKEVLTFILYKCH